MNAPPLNTDQKILNIQKPLRLDGQKVNPADVDFPNPF